VPPGTGLATSTSITANRRSLSLRLATDLNKKTGERACVASDFRRLRALVFSRGQDPQTTQTTAAGLEDLQWCSPLVWLTS